MVSPLEGHSRQVDENGGMVGMAGALLWFGDLYGPFRSERHVRLPEQQESQIAQQIGTIAWALADERPVARCRGIEEHSRFFRMIQMVVGTLGRRRFLDWPVVVASHVGDRLFARSRRTPAARAGIASRERRT